MPYFISLQGNQIVSLCLEIGHFFSSMKDLYFLETSSEGIQLFSFEIWFLTHKSQLRIGFLVFSKAKQTLLINFIILMKLINLFIIISNLLNEEALPLMAIHLKSPVSLYCPCLRIISSLIVDCVFPCILFGEFTEGLCLMEGASDCKMSDGVCS